MLDLGRGRWHQHGLLHRSQPPHLELLSGGGATHALAGRDDLHAVGVAPLVGDVQVAAAILDRDGSLMVAVMVVVVVGWQCGARVGTGRVTGSHGGAEGGWRLLEAAKTLAVVAGHR